MTELCDRVLRAGGPALLFENKGAHAFPVLGNLFGTPRRVALGMGVDAQAGEGDGAALESLGWRRLYQDSTATLLAR